MRFDLYGFASIRPPYETAQQETIEWLAEGHSRTLACETKQGEVRAALARVGCKPDQIFKRGHIISDYLHRNWDKMEIYHGLEGGACIEHRMKFFEEHADQVFQRFYPLDAIAPNDLIHVSCTGYVSPSGAQKLVARKGWHRKSQVMHAYHMGCYGAISALRIARGFAACDRRSDIVHTEMCSLHSNLACHQLGQFVTESLFADGFIKYSASKKSPAATPHLQVLALLEEIVPDSEESMAWKIANRGFEMTLSIDVPLQIARAIKGYIERLEALADLPKEALVQTASFAVHPGGPKILQRTQAILGLKDEQMAHSKAVLQEYGNMSSATIPHIWQRVLEDNAIPGGTPIASLAFGPGLTICGAVMVKCGG